MPTAAHRPRMQSAQARLDAEKLLRSRGIRAGRVYRVLAPLRAEDPTEILYLDPMGTPATALLREGGEMSVSRGW